MDDVDRRLVEYAKRRYDHDAEFHAKVHIAVQTLARARSEKLTVEEVGLARTAAALGLAMEWVDPVTGEIFDG